MEKNLFRKESVDHISSPEQLHDYMHVTTPRLWMLLSAVLVLLLGMVVYAFTTTMESTVKVMGRVEYGTIYAYIPSSAAETVKIRMPVRINGKSGYISNVSQGTRLRIFVSFDGGKTLEDGIYEMTGDGTESLPGDEEGYGYYLQADDGVITVYDDQDRLLKYFKTDRRVRINGSLATVTGTQEYEIATLIFTMSNEADIPPDGTCDVEIITESTTPMRFLLN